MKVSTAIALAVAAEAGPAPIFSLIGDANLPIVGALDRDTDATQWFARDEGAAVAMADGYSRASDNLGIATVTSGPGLTHAATSLLAASRTRSTLVVVAGDTSMRRPSGLQEMQSFDQRRFVESCEARFVGLRSPFSLDDDIASAFYHARSDRTPVVVSAPLDLQAMDVPDGWTYRPSADMTQRPPLPLGDAETRMILDAIGKAKRPLIIGGRGAARSGARDDLSAVAQKIGALLGTTLFAKGLFDDESWNIGVVGGFSNPAIQDVIRDADLVIAFGAELGHFTTQAGSLMQGRQVIRIDHDPAKTFASRHALSIIRADARAAAAVLRTELADSADRTGFRTDETGKRIAAPWTLGGPEPQGDLIDPRQLMRDLGEALPAGAKLAVGGGHFWSFPCIYMKQPRGARFLVPLGAAAVGQVLPFGIGVAAANPASPTVIIEVTAAC
jgi:thiamine pyrophosphate-dependent acetolactate synthase large subunit-like protein